MIVSCSTECIVEYGESHCSEMKQLETLIFLDFPKIDKMYLLCLCLWQMHSQELIQPSICSMEWGGGGAEPRKTLLNFNKEG